MIPKKIPLTDWLFAAGDGKDCLDHAQSVRVPHTWSVDEAGQYHVGAGWYRTTVSADELAGRERVFLHFHSVYRDADVYVNGQPVGCHYGSGYTPFTLEITSALQKGEATEIAVRVDNRFSSAALPFERSFDWANDGGIFRPAELLLTGASRIRECAVHAKPLISATGTRFDVGMAFFGFDLAMDGNEDSSLVWTLVRGAEQSMTPVQEKALLSGSASCGQLFTLAPVLLFDYSKLTGYSGIDDRYQIELVVTSPESLDGKYLDVLH